MSSLSGGTNKHTHTHTKMGSSISEACKHKCTQCPWDALGCSTALQDLLLVFQLFLNSHVEQNSQNECFWLALTYLLAGRKLHPELKIINIYKNGGGGGGGGNAQGQGENPPVLKKRKKKKRKEQTTTTKRNIIPCHKLCRNSSKRRNSLASSDGQLLELVFIWTATQASHFIERRDENAQKIITIVNM